MSDRPPLPPAGVTVIGVGNPIMGDDGLGLAVLGRLREEWAIPEQVTLVDGGTWGMNLLPVIDDSVALIFVDAITAGKAPGTPVVLTREQLPKWVAVKLSPHQVDLKEVLALAELRGTLPELAVAVGAQPASVEMSLALSAEVAAVVDDVAARVAAQLTEWGHPCVRQAAACTR